MNLVYDYLLVVPVIDTNTNTVVDTITVVNTPVVIDYDKSMRKYMRLTLIMILSINYSNLFYFVA